MLTPFPTDGPRPRRLGCLQSRTPNSLAKFEFWRDSGRCRRCSSASCSGAAEPLDFLSGPMIADFGEA